MGPLLKRARPGVLAETAARMVPTAGPGRRRTLRRADAMPGSEMDADALERVVRSGCWLTTVVEEK